MAVTHGRAGGKKGGKARAAKLSSEQRSEIAKRAAAKRRASKSQEELRSLSQARSVLARRSTVAHQSLDGAVPPCGIG